jgi:hypothetical protein
LFSYFIFLQTQDEESSSEEDYSSESSDEGFDDESGSDFDDDEDGSDDSERGLSWGARALLLFF